MADVHARVRLWVSVELDAPWRGSTMTADEFSKIASREALEKLCIALQQCPQIKITGKPEVTAILSVLEGE